MAGKKFYSLITIAGLERLATAAVSGEPVGFALMAVGDGNGLLPTPEVEQSGLVNEVYRSSLNSLKITDAAANVFEAELLIPPQVGGFTMREAALFDEDGVCLAVANMPETYKPLLAEGSGRFSIIRIQLAVNSTADIQLINDPGVVVATIEDVIKIGSETKDYTDDQLSDHVKSRNHPDATLTAKGFTQLSNKIDSDSDALAATPAAIKAAIAAAVRQAWELSNPKGISLFFFEKVNPNELWPWSTWEYTGEDRTVRLAKQDGSNVGQLGGSDTVTITRANLPNEQLNISGDTSQQAAQTLSTKPAGKHVHKGGMRGPGAEYDSMITGTDNDGRYSLNYTSEDGDHIHNMDVPAHSHTISGKTDALGQGQAISIVEKHVLQMCWHRVA
ncbi:phage tail protein [Serratia fonticola]|uniref:phage tail-collar fiber domain-containing protein n=1 Tax=Serratia fonticola TaxID=47917 RepID=UPI0013781EF8|nr:phage tail protein [Serratia fonticola]